MRFGANGADRLVKGAASLIMINDAAPSVIRPAARCR